MRLLYDYNKILHEKNLFEEGYEEGFMKLYKTVYKEEFEEGGKEKFEKAYKLLCEKGYKEESEEAYKLLCEEGYKEKFEKAYKVLCEKAYMKSNNYRENLRLVTQICCKLKMNKSPEMIADELDENFPAVVFICKEAESFAPEYDAVEVMKSFL